MEYKNTNNLNKISRHDRHKSQYYMKMNMVNGKFASIFN